MKSNIQEITDDELVRMMAEASIPPPEGTEPKEPSWLPSLTPKQMDLFLARESRLLAAGPRYTGKGYSCGFKVIKHCYDNPCAHALVVVKSKRQGVMGGFFHKLGTEILPLFRDNIKDFTFKGPFVSTEKDILYKVTNRWGGESIIQLMSVLHDQNILSRIKGAELSLVYLDEAQLFIDPQVYSALTATLGRRAHVPPEEQIFLASCNPTDPKHWLYQKWFVECKDSEGNLIDPDFRHIELHVEDNPDKSRVIPYVEKMKRDLKNQPTLYKRDIDGLWVAAPEGDAIFASSYIPEFHCKGNLKKGEFLLPKPGVRCVVGMDVGDTNHGIVFLQERITRDKVVWIAFDEIVHVGKQVNLEVLTKEIMQKMQFWCELMDYDFSWTFISDKSAFDRFRASNGSFDHLTIQKHFKNLMSKFSRIKQALKILECPKPQGSVSARTRLLIDLLTEERFFVSAKCVNLIEMLLNITGTKEDPFVPNTHSPYKHALDSCTYPLLYMNVGGSVTAQEAPTEEMRPQLLRVGS